MYPRHGTHGLAATAQLAGQHLEVPPSEPGMMEGVLARSVQRRRLGEDQRVEVSRDDDTVPPEARAEELLRSRLHRPHPRPAGQQERAVDVEKDQRLRASDHARALYHTGRFTEATAGIATSAPGTAPVL